MAETPESLSCCLLPGVAGGDVSDARREELVPEVEEWVSEGEEDIDLDLDSSSPAYNFSNPSFFEDYTSSLDLVFSEDLVLSEDHDHGSECGESNFFFFGSEGEEDPINLASDLFGHEGAVDEDLNWGAEPDHIGSQVDYLEFEVNSGIIDHYDDDMDLYSAGDGSEAISRSNDPVVGIEEFEWEEVSDARFYVSENLNSVINRIEEISVYSDSGEQDALHLGQEQDWDYDQETAEWEFLLAMRSSDIESLHGNPPGDYTLPMEYETPSSGSPPAARSAVENLPWMVLTEKDVGANKLGSCAVCKDEFAVGEKMATMPCHHVYHVSCILPWLSVRNTCPVCRFELPTDDPYYERRRGGGGETVDDEEFLMRYHFEVLPL